MPLTPDDSSRSDWVERKLAELRARLEATGEWPESADELFQHLAQAGQSGLSAEDADEMLAVVVSDALEGVDIAERYPAFFRRLLADAGLRQSFLDMLDILEGSRSGALEPLPVPPSRDLSFLKKVAPPPTPGPWPALWLRTVEQLQALFRGLGGLEPGVAYRSADQLLEEESITLLREQTTVDETQLEVLLEATWNNDLPDTLDLSLTVAISGPEQAGDTAPRFEAARFEAPLLKATLQWGSYQATAVLDRHGRAFFPPLPFQAVSDAGDDVDHPLQLSLEPVTGDK